MHGLLFVIGSTSNIRLVRSGSKVNQGRVCGRMKSLPKVDWEIGARKPVTIRVGSRVQA